MKKRILAAVLVCVAALFSGCGRVPTREAEPPFFVVADEQTGGMVYLLGTMHVAPKNCALPDRIYEALLSCDTLAVEVDLIALEADNERLSEAMKLMECQGETARDFLGEDYDEIRAFFRKKRLYNSAFDRYIPAVWSSILTNKLAEDCGYYSEYGTDRLLLSYARSYSIPIYEIESAEQQYQINANEPRELQVFLLKDSVRTDYEVQKNQLKELYRAWSESDFDALERLIAEEEIPENLTEEYEQFYFEMYENRQAKMAEYIVDSLKNGDRTFVAVGAMHYFAAPDILDFLEREGYSIQLLSEAA
ncbi:MAG: TraB/GumN family protein [Oscillospiraceae bacterium]|nr:TraB/GumN family protein [Oscillospiraceae bacterium]